MKAKPGPGRDGYSGTPLPRKLGLRPGHRVLVIGEPQGFRGLISGTEAEILLARDAAAAADLHEVDVVVLFVDRRAELERRSVELGLVVKPHGALWVAWPRRASRVATDLTEAILRDILLPTGMVDNKVCAIDATWSGLRFVWRVTNR